MIDYEEAMKDYIQCYKDKSRIIFIEKYLYDGPKEILTYNVWIARYGEYRPYIKLLYWQLSPYGRVKGIHGDVDINVFNGSKEQFEQYVNNGWADLP